MIFSIRLYLLKEKDKKSIESKKKDGKKISSSLDSSLVLSIDKKGKITKFNKECEKITGYKKSEVLNKNIFDFLIPKNYFNKWKNLLDKSLNNKLKDDLKLPLLTKNGKEFMICWSNFPIKNPKGDVIDISLVGTLIESFEESIEQPQESSKFEKKGITSESPIKSKKIVINEPPKEDIRKLDEIDDNEDQREVIFEEEIPDIKPRQDIFSSKKRKQEKIIHDDMIRELNERENFLKEQESRLAEEKMKIDEQADKFVKWRQKLESLEDQLENKREGLSTQEKPLTIEDKGLGEIAHKEKKDQVVPKDRNVIEKISDCAVIIQRGILKQVNNSFANLIGYDIDDLKNKSLFDFIIPEGFSDIEKYYLDRLKGVDISVYKTVFLTKDNEKIQVEVNTKPTDFNGIKAEIAIIKKLENKKEL